MILFWDKNLAPWAAARIERCERGFGPCQALGVAKGDELIAVVVFHNWQPEAGVVEVSAAADTPRWYSRKLIKAALGYAFDELGCQTVIARQAPDNDRARGIWLALGGTEYVIPRLRGRDEAESIITLTDDAWRSSRFYKGN